MLYLLPVGLQARRGERAARPLRGLPRLQPGSPMKLVELVFPPAASEETRARVR
ncbi:MAG: hypothetical protein M3088_04095, partial [Actinomycetota bacterium]|nr:hypothetical protein [Actinomycetota bacterium]